ncbi:hypothetical protein NGRA_2786 [Nosema granulosis]|uniref:Uncharacterized protein n=1 Tax=Nosema granulosis TaxID=83296 RepID=A0A9P6GVY5_9MICR|nr:hypothetical protein NGRA_2786 [Nosema granulosis]
MLRAIAHNHLLHLLKEKIKTYLNYILCRGTTKTKTLSLIVDHLSNLNDKMITIFSSFETLQYGWIINLFSEINFDSNLTIREKEDLIDLSTDLGLLVKFEDLKLEVF